MYSNTAAAPWSGLAREFAKSNDIRKAYSSFEWRKKRLPEAWEDREKLAEQTASYKMGGDIIALGNAVHRWGFGGRDVPEKSGKDAQFPGLLAQMILSWRKDSMGEEQETSLAKLMDIDQIGIARASKWVCFVDQTRYGIYDSRVSLALRNVLIEGRRVFPIVARKPLKDKPAWRPDIGTGETKKVARLYIQYIKFLREVATLTTHRDGRAFLPAEVEMGLFMLGNVWPDKSERHPFMAIEEK